MPESSDVPPQTKVNFLPLGETGFRLFPLSYGCFAAGGGYGHRLSQAELIEVLQAAFKAGVNYIDTAALYGSTMGDNEQELGRAINFLVRRGDIRRNNILVGTKCGLIGEVLGDKFVLTVKNGYDYIVRSCNESLTRLGVKCLDLFWLHRHDLNVDIKRVADSMAQLIKGGKVKYVGLSEVSAETAERFHRALAVHGFSDRFVGVQNELSIANQESSREMLDLCHRLSKTFFAFSPLAHGMLTNRSTAEECFRTPGRSYFYPQFDVGNKDVNLRFVSRLESMAQKKNCTVPQLCLAWVVAQAALPLISTTNVGHLLSNAKAASIQLTLEDCDALSYLCAQTPIMGARASADLAKLAPEVHKSAELEQSTSSRMRQPPLMEQSDAAMLLRPSRF